MDVVITLKYKVNGPDKKDENLSNSYLKKKKLYQDILHPYEFKNKNLNIEIQKQKIILTIKKLKIDNKEDFINNFNSNFTDAWGEGLFEFGKEYYYFANNHNPLERKEIKNIKSYNNSYYILSSVSLPVGSKYLTNNCRLIKNKRVQYFYKDIQVTKIKNKYLIPSYQLPEIFKKDLKIKDEELPKKYYKDIIETDEYLVCYAPKKYQNKVLLEKNKNINEIFYRHDNMEGLHLDNKIIYKGKLNNIFFKEALIKVIN